jgi:tetratricopeptide (TPR) repeat protein
MSQDASLDELLIAGLAQHRAGRLADAENVYRQILRDAPRHVTALRLLGILSTQQGKYTEAIALLQQAYTLSGKHPGVALELAQVCQSAGKTQEADQLFRIAIASTPPLPKALANYGQFLTSQNRHSEAVEILNRWTELEPTGESFYQLGLALVGLKKHKEALEVFRRCIEIARGLAKGHGAVGACFLELDAPIEAEAPLRRSLELDPNDVSALYNLGNSLYRQNRLHESIEPLETAIRLQPDNPLPHVNLATPLVALGDWKRGFEELEWRLKIPGVFAVDPRAGKRRWQGEHLNNEPILIYAEGGLGDGILYARYATLVAERGGRVTLACKQPLVRLFARIPGVERATTLEDPGPFNLYCPLSSLPYVFATTPDNVPGRDGYLTAYPEDLEKWRQKLQRRDGRRRIGLVWSGSVENVCNSTRSLPLAMLEPLASIENTAFYSVQKGPGADQVASTPSALKLIDLTADLDDMADTAAFLMNLDLLISVETSVSHLCGALGHPTFIMLPFATDSRWMVDRNDSPWYASARLFRQQRLGDWKELLSRVLQAL